MVVQRRKLRRQLHRKSDADKIAARVGVGTLGLVDATAVHRHRTDSAAGGRNVAILRNPVVNIDARVVGRVHQCRRCNRKSIPVVVRVDALRTHRQLDRQRKGGTRLSPIADSNPPVRK